MKCFQKLKKQSVSNVLFHLLPRLYTEVPVTVVIPYDVAGFPGPSGNTHLQVIRSPDERGLEWKTVPGRDWRILPL